MPDVAWVIRLPRHPFDYFGDYFFATLEALEPASFAKWEWLDLDDGTYDGVLWSPDACVRHT